MVKQGLELQLCVLECLVLAGYDPQISRSLAWGCGVSMDAGAAPETFLGKLVRFQAESATCRRDPEQICRIAEETTGWSRSRFLFGGWFLFATK